MARRRVDDPRSDNALIAVCNEGNAREAARAFDVLYQRHKDYVLRVALRFVPDTDTALDVLQETFLYLLRQFPPAGPGIELTAQVTTLLYPVAKNTALTALRRGNRFPAADIEPDELAETTEPGAAGDAAAVIAALPERQREVLRLRFVDGMTLAEIAQVLDIPLGTVKSRLHVGIGRLKSSGVGGDLRE